ncbi:TPA: TonB family protein [Proteus mirabilis]|uniref:TonB family protein n=1 Tax=Proteus mirabilis TaxID=584 RepID=UPI00224873E5|nr:energy transducer TonB [Proteus mirabilis]ELT0938229.1 energy transducer TonB [Proteus mirabilis]MCW9722004.1 energy transducer TonB [Proteus mirabilis]
MLALSVRQPLNIYYWLIAISLLYISLLSWVLNSWSMTESAHHIDQQQQNTLSVYQVMFSPPKQSTTMIEPRIKIESQQPPIALPRSENGEFIEAPKQPAKKRQQQPAPITPKAIKQVKKQPVVDKTVPITLPDLTNHNIVQSTSQPSAENLTQHTASSLAGSSRALSEHGIGQGESENHYISLLRREIERHKRYPAQARRMQDEGLVVVRFSLTNEGYISSVALEQTSGVASLDNAALAAVKRVKPIGPKPNNLSDPLTISLKFQLN